MGALGWVRAALNVPVLPVGDRFVPLESPWAPTDVLTRITVDDLWPGFLTDEFAPVPRSQAMSVPAVAAARHRIVGTLARLPITPTVKDGTDWASDNSGLFDQPDPAVPHVVTMTRTLDDIFFAGRAWWAVTAAYATGHPRDVAHVPLDDVVITDDGWPELDARYAGWLGRANRKVLDHPGTHVPAGVPWLLEFTGPHDGVCNFGGRAIRSAVDLDASTARAARNPVPSLELHQTTDADLDDTEVAAMIAAWERARRQNTVGYTNAAVELRTHGVQPEQLLINARNQQAVEVARLAGIPAAAIDAAIPGASLTYANLVDRLRDLISFGLQPYAAAVTGRLSMDDVCPHGVAAEFDYSELLPDVPTPQPSVSPA